MLELDRRASSDAPAATTLTLPWERRGVTRQRVRLEDGREAGVFLPRDGQFVAAIAACYFDASPFTP